MNLSQDAKIGDLTIRKGDEFMIDIQALHMNARVWPEPFEFRPERFNQGSDASLTANGSRRIASSWAPFAGGKRVCLGKSFADSTLKITSIYLSQFFNF